MSMPNHTRKPLLRVATAFFLVLGILLGTACAPAGADETGGTDDNPETQRQAVADGSGPVGKWYLVANGARLELNISASGGVFSGTIGDEGTTPQSISNVTWNATNRWLEFRRDGSGFFQWYRLSLTEGVVSGRFSHGASSAKPILTAFVLHVTGWSPSYLDTDIVPRTWRVALNTNYQGVLRIDRDSAGTLQGRLKVFDNSAETEVQEELEYDLTPISWNGTSLSFTRADPGFTQVFSGTAAGRSISGTFTQNGGAPIAWSGTRAEVTGFGLGSRLSQRAGWQEKARRRIVNLTEGMQLAGGSTPAVGVTTQPCTGCPFTSGSFPAERDDNPNAWPPNYTLQRLKFSFQPGNRFDPANLPPAREYFGYLSTPTTAPPAGGYRVMVVVNGHGGSAQQLLTLSNSDFWHGESAARRNLVVLAIDIGHRPVWGTGPIVHSAIVGTGYTSSDWEEDGERAFSVRRAVDYLATLPNIRMDRIFISGLSMGGEVTTISAALDGRFVMAMPSGYSPDMYVMDNYGNHPCYRWNNADIHEYVDVSDYQALIAPRQLVVETGLVDFTFSPLAAPFAADKQVARRARAAYGTDSAQYVHYLHYGAHQFHIGDLNPTFPSRPQSVRAAAVIAPSSPTDLTWQTNDTTNVRSPSLYHLMNESLL
jgi:hypothetical protein